MLMMATELGEAFEPFADAPRRLEHHAAEAQPDLVARCLVANAKAVRQHAGLMLDAMVQDFERATGPWQVEWIALPESFILAAGALRAGALHAGRAGRRRRAACAPTST